MTVASLFMKKYKYMFITGWNMILCFKFLFENDCILQLHHPKKFGNPCKQKPK